MSKNEMFELIERLCGVCQDERMFLEDALFSRRDEKMYLKNVDIALTVMEQAIAEVRKELEKNG